MGYHPASIWDTLFIWTVAILFFGSGIGGVIAASLNTQPIIPLILWGIFFSMIVAFFVGQAISRAKHKLMPPAPAPRPLTISVDAFYRILDA
jgi:hypothetical protein